jgi:hypothetical protein
VSDAEHKAEEYSEANAHDAAVEAAEAVAAAPDLMATPPAE